MARRPARAARTRELQIRPGLALLARAAQQVGRVIGHDQRHARGAERCTCPRNRAERRIGGEQVLRRDATDRQDEPRLEQLDLPLR